MYDMEEQQQQKAETNVVLLPTTAVYCCSFSKIRKFENSTPSMYGTHRPPHKFNKTTAPHN